MKMRSGLFFLGMSFVAAPLVAQNKYELCLAVRGNGHYVPSHFSAMARIQEEWGPAEAVAGTSSATISLFLYRAIQSSELLKDMAIKDKNTTAAFLLKSIYALLIKWSDQVLNDTTSPSPRPIILQNNHNQKKFVFAPWVHLIPHFLNPESVGFFSRSIQNPFFYEHEARLGWENVTSYRSQPDDPAIFTRPGPLDFAQLASFLGQLADFYKTGPNINAADLLACGAKTVGKTWFDETLDESARSCSQDFLKRADEYMKAHYFDPAIAGEAIPESDLLKEVLSEGIPAWISTSLITDQSAVQQFKRAREGYLSENKRLIDGFSTDLPSIRNAFMYGGDFGLTQELRARFKDLKSQHTLVIDRPVTWAEALQMSPAEPGLSSAVDFSDGPSESMSLGGWIDPSPVQVLRAAGCAKVIYLTRRGEESGFLTAMMNTLLGRGRGGDDALLDAQVEGWFSLEGPTENQAVAPQQSQGSGSQVAIHEALTTGGVYCTNWNAFGDAEMKEMISDAYQSPLYSLNPLMPSATTPQSFIKGCTSE